MDHQYCCRLLELMQHNLHSKYLMLWVHLKPFKASLVRARVLLHVQSLQFIIWNNTMDDLHLILT